MEIIRVGDIQTWAGFFRKKAGKYVYLRISDSAMGYLGLNGDNNVVGVAFNGNVCVLDSDTEVVQCDVLDMVRNVIDGRM